MKAEREFLVIGVRARNGENWIDVLPAADTSEAISVNLIQGEFLGPIYELPEWCMDHGFQCVITPQTISVEFPDMTTE